MQAQHKWEVGGTYNICIEIIPSEKEWQVLGCSPSWPQLPQNSSSSLQLYFCTMSCCCIPAEVMLYFLGFSYILVFYVDFKKCVRKRGGQGGGWRCGIQIVHQYCISCGTAMKLLWGRMIPYWAVLIFCLICKAFWSINCTLIKKKYEHCCLISNRTTASFSFMRWSLVKNICV